MKLGTLLLRNAAISLTQLEAALRAQVIYGGRLGTNLVELGFVDLDALSMHLGELTQHHREHHREHHRGHHRAVDHADRHGSRRAAAGGIEAKGQTFRRRTSAVPRLDAPPCGAAGHRSALLRGHGSRHRQHSRRAASGSDRHGDRD